MSFGCMTEVYGPWGSFEDIPTQQSQSVKLKTHAFNYHEGGGRAGAADL